jgi:hypothetical protein
MKNMKAVITVRCQVNDNPMVTFERSFRTARMAMNYRDVVIQHGIRYHWVILEEVADDMIGRWDGKSL